MRFSIEISPEQHQRLKAAATSRGKTIRDHILEKALSDEDKRLSSRTGEKPKTHKKTS